MRLLFATVAATLTLAAPAYEAAVDPHGDGNMFSFYYRSRLAIHLADGTAYDNEDLRDDAHGLSSDDGWPREYSYVDIARSPDG
jgi:hypothetical protein